MWDGGVFYCATDNERERKKKATQILGSIFLLVCITRCVCVCEGTRSPDRRSFFWVVREKTVSVCGKHVPRKHKTWRWKRENESEVVGKGRKKGIIIISNNNNDNNNHNNH